MRRRFRGDGKQDPARCAWRARCGGRSSPGGHGLAHAEPDVGHDRRLAAVRGRLRRRLGSRLRGDAPHLRRRRRRLAGHVHAPRRQLRVQGRAEQRLGRELRPARGVERREHPARPSPRRERQVLLRPQDPLGHRQQELGDRGRARQLPVRARLPRRLGARLPALVARGSRTATASTPSRRRALPAGSYEAQGRDQRELGRELRRGRRPGRREHPVHGSGRQHEGHVLLRRGDARADRRRSRAAGAPGGPARSRTSTWRARTASAPRATRPRRSGSRSPTAC